MASAAATLPTGFYEEAVTAASAYRMTAFAFLADGRISIAAKPGVLRVYQNGALLVAPLLNIHEPVNQHEDRGLFGSADDPAFDMRSTTNSAPSSGWAAR